ncbi:hypothetical protein [Nocardia sp. NBC_01329]|uniref:hypothetical protein n=1 Tax=Nocardia sp. NBC_01329 TaxID=2903594 RepID=UPI002E1007AE|nr:hypothetical protein OG405_04125 [Nocardia sp. NBC_01329]
MAVSNNAVRHRARTSLQTARRAAITAAGLAAAVSLLPAPAADAAGPAHRPAPAAAAVRALTAPGTSAEIPADFRAVAGYIPARADGMLVAPHGSCSSPVPLPAEFDSACKAHDLGYDLLRYADHTGAPLGPWARRDLDHALAERMRTACGGRPDPLPRTRCAAMAEVAAAAVALNSMRQDYGVPVVEDFPLADTVTGWLPRLCGLLLLALALLVLLRGPVAAPLLPSARRPLLSFATIPGGSHA